MSLFSPRFTWQHLICTRMLLYKLCLLHEWLKKTKIITKAYWIVNSTYTVISYTDRCTLYVLYYKHWPPLWGGTKHLEKGGGGRIYQRIDIEHNQLNRALSSTHYTFIYTYILDIGQGYKTGRRYCLTKSQ